MKKLLNIPIGIARFFVAVIFCTGLFLYSTVESLWLSANYVYAYVRYDVSLSYKKLDINIPQYR